MSVFAFGAEPQGQPMSYEELVESALNEPLSIGGTLLQAAKGAAVESFGLGTVLRGAQTPGGRSFVGPAPTITNFATGQFTTPRWETDEEVAARGEKPLSEDEYRASQYFRESVPYDRRMTEDRAAALASWADAKAVRDHFTSKRPITQFFGGFAGSATDPINYIPFVGPAARVAAVGKLGRIAGTAATAAADAAINTAIVGTLTAPLRAQYGDDVSWQTTVQQAALAAFIGAGFGATHSAIRSRIDARRVARAQERLSTLQNAQKAVVALNEAVGDLTMRNDIALGETAAGAVDDIARSIERIETEPTLAGRLLAQPDNVRLKLDEVREILAERAPEYTMERQGRNWSIRSPSGEVVWSSGGTTNVSGMRAILSNNIARDRATLPPPAAEPTGTLRLVRRGTDEGSDMFDIVGADGEPVGEAWAKVRGDTAVLEGIRSLDERPNAFGPREIRGLLRQFREAYPDVKRIEAERVSGARTGGQFDPRQGVQMGVNLPASRFTPPPEPPDPAKAPAEARVGKPSTPREAAEQFGVDPETGAFPEEDILRQLEVEGRLTEEDAATLAEADADYERGVAFGEAMRAAAACLI